MIEELAKFANDETLLSKEGTNVEVKESVAYSLIDDLTRARKVTRIVGK